MKKFIAISLLIFIPFFASASFDRDLFYGARNNAEVQELQEFLADEGFYSGSITGNFFSLTLKAVKKFQTANKIIPASGYFGAKTRSKANELLSQLGVTSTTIQSEKGIIFQTAPVAPPKKTDDITTSLLEQIKLLQQQLIVLQQKTSAVSATASAGLATLAMPVVAAPSVITTPVSQSPVVTATPQLIAPAAQAQTAMPSPTPASNTIPQSSGSMPQPQIPIGYWKFDETLGNTANDSSGNNNSGSLINADVSAVWVVGKFGNAVSFDGIDDFLSIPHSASLNLGDVADSYTVALWFKKSGNHSDDRRIIGKNDGHGLYPFNERILSNGKASFIVYDGSNAPTAISTKTVTDGHWHHIVGVRDAANDMVRMYIDGNEDATPVRDTTHGSIQNDDAVWIDRYETSVGPYRYADFSLDDVRIYNRALSSVEILQLYTGQ